MKLHLRTIWLLVTWLLVSVACGTRLAPANPTPTPPAAGPTKAAPTPAASPVATAPPDATPAPAGEFTATALSAVSVALAWQPVADATGYQLTARYTGGEPFSVADLAAAETGYVHFVVPGSRSLTYQLTALTAAGSRAAASAEVTLPVLAPQPVVVENLVAASASPGGPALTPLPTIDPLNPDPDALATLAAFAEGLGSAAATPQPTTLRSQQAIGPEGGVLTLIGPNEVVFTLEVPPGAVNAATTLYLTALSEVSAFPLAAGPLGAVQIQPPIQFAAPLTLTIAAPAAASAAGAHVLVGFTVSSFSHELALAPLYPGAPGSYQMTVYWGDTFGLAFATLDEIQAQAGRLPSDPGEQLDQQLAVLRAFDPDPSPEAAARILSQILAGLVEQVGALPAQASARPPAGLAALARRPPASAAGQRLWSAINLSDRFLSNQRVASEQGDTPIVISPMDQARQQAIIDGLVEQIKTFLDAHTGCRARDDFYARAIVRLLQAPTTSFQRQLAITYTGRFGPPPDQVDCTYQLHITRSKIVLLASDSEGSLTVTLVVHADPITLEPVMRGDQPALRGVGPVTYEQYNYDFSQCPPPLDVTNLPAAVLWITDLRPIFDADDRVSNFALQGALPDPIASGSNLGAVTTETDDNNQCHIVNFKPGDPHPDTWGLGFADMHNPVIHSDTWTIVGDQSYVATSSVTDWPLGRITESTDMILTVNQVSR